MLNNNKKMDLQMLYLNYLNTNKNKVIGFGIYYQFIKNSIVIIQKNIILK